jgi:hypothetical protein
LELTTVNNIPGSKEKEKLIVITVKFPGNTGALTGKEKPSLTMLKLILLRDTED